ncbi:MAG: transporter substrate-binding domain-containing protein [Alphaproteobacteria bacterium]|nr:transporter substrate-binding domain-containing protein [Alphaproteobacteria bacterium]
MKVFFSLLSILAGFVATDANAQKILSGAEVRPVVQPVVQPKNSAPEYAENITRPETNGISTLRRIKQRDKVRCGSNLQLKSYAYREDETWHGIDADFCKAIALAVVGDADHIEMVNVEGDEVAYALKNGKIDIMLSGGTATAKTEILHKLMPVGVLYYEPQMLLMSEHEGKDNEDFIGKKICVTDDSDYFRNYELFNSEHNLESKYLKFPSMKATREGFLLKRCDMATGGAVYLNGMKQAMAKTKFKIFPEPISVAPVMATVARGNNDFGLTVKWVINGLQLAEQYGMTAKNLNFFRGHNNPEIRNLMGDNSKLWVSLGAFPKWLDQAIAIVGNYGEIFERNVGMESDYKIKRKQGKLIKDGGVVYPQPFL